MKQAVLITAYKNFEHLQEIINFFDHDFSIYIHLDKKSRISEGELIKLKNNIQVKHVSRKYNVNWGGFNHLKSILHLCEIAMKSKDVFYFHLISGHDFPIKGLKAFKGFFLNNKESQYIDIFDMPSPGWSGNGGMNRLEYFNLYDFFNAKIDKQHVSILRLLIIQKKLGFKRSYPSKMPKLYGGSTWWSLSRECLSFVLNYTKNNKGILNRFKFTLCSEEFYFPTVIMNSPFSSKVERSNLRYIDWNSRNGNYPAILDETDYEKLRTSEAFFARKFEPTLSDALMEKIKETVND